MKLLIFDPQKKKSFVWSDLTHFCVHKRGGQSQVTYVETPTEFDVKTIS